MIKEVICRLKLHLSLNSHNLSVTVLPLPLQHSPVASKKIKRYTRRPLTQRLLLSHIKTNQTVFKLKRRVDLLLNSMTHLQLDISGLLRVAFDISVPRRVFYVCLASYL